MRKKQTSLSRRPTKSASASAQKNQDRQLKPPCVVAAVVERGKHDKIVRLFYEYGIFLTSLFMGQGTAGSEIMDILGLENSEKDVVLGFGSYDSAAAVMNALNDRLSAGTGSKGIAFCLRLSAAPGLLIKAAEIKTAKNLSEEKTVDEQKYSLILISVNQGYADEVMACCKKAGARGGTLIRARQFSNEETESLFGAAFTPEREIIAIVTTRDKRAAVMESVNARHGVRSESGAVVLALPVEEIAKLS